MMSDTIHEVPHTAACLAAAAICAVENARDAVTDGNGYDMATFRQAVTDSLATAEGYLSDGLASCRCPDTDTRQCAHCGEVIHRRHDVDTSNLTADGTDWRTGLRPGRTSWRPLGGEVWCDARRPAVLPHTVATVTLDSLSLRAGMVVRTHGMRVRLDSLVSDTFGSAGRRVAAWRGSVLNMPEVRAAGIVPASFVRDGMWTVQGNDLATWTVEVTP
jgi:hypothetical protein